MIDEEKLIPTGITATLTKEQLGNGPDFYTTISFRLSDKTPENMARYWIDVKDAVPDAMEQVLALDNINTTYGYHVAYCVLRYDHACNKWKDVDGRNGYVVTHWMKLPGLPNLSI